MTLKQFENLSICRKPACEHADGIFCRKGRMVVANAMGAGCPIGKFPAITETKVPLNPVYVIGPETWGPPMWMELHAQTAPTPAWFAAWRAKIPAMGCQCQQHADELFRLYPPDFSSADAFFAWSVKIHNLVNAMNSKPVVSLEDAKKIHGR